MTTVSLLNYIGCSTAPSQIALLSGARSLNRLDLRHKVEALAARLQGLGVKTVALYADNGIDWIITDLACQLCNIRIVPLPLFFSRDQVNHALATSGADALISDQKAVAEILDNQPAISLEQPFSGATNLYVLAPNGDTVLPPETQKITYTSGTTGTPKGVCLSVKQQIAVSRGIASTIELDRPTHLCVLPLSTLLENLAGVYAPLLAGGTVVVPPLADVGLSGSSDLDVGTLLDCISQHRPNSLILVPEILKALLIAAECGWRPPPSLRFVAVGGGKVAPELLRRARQSGLPAFEGYGLSECASVVTLNTPGADRIGAVGRPLPHVSVQIDEDEIIISGNAFLGYANQPETWESGPVRTGDLGRIDSDGFVYIDGRKKSQLITSYGRNVSPEWLESELTVGPVLRQAAVFGDARPFFVALLYPQDASVSDTDIAAWVHKTNLQLPDYARILEWHRVHQAFSSENGLTTENGRVKRDAIENYYSLEINQMYESNLEASSS